uniref:Uncharacterized protein n=1 Tax=Electrophorus electricus TaxID=8005 RepID=A0AAY5EA65_ELEEL
MFLSKRQKNRYRYISIYEIDETEGATPSPYCPLEARQGAVWPRGLGLSLLSFQTHFAYVLLITKRKTLGEERHNQSLMAAGASPHWPSPSATSLASVIVCPGGLTGLGPSVRRRCFKSSLTLM